MRGLSMALYKTPRPLFQKTLELRTRIIPTWGIWLIYLTCTILGFCTADYFWSMHDVFSKILPHFPGPAAPEAIGLLTSQLYGMVFLLILLVLSRRFFPKVAPYIAFFAIGFVINALLEGMLFAYVHLYEGSFFGPPN